MKMLRDVTGTQLINPAYVKRIRVTTDADGLMKYIVADVSGMGGVVTLRKVNTWEVVGADAYIKRQLELSEEDMNNG